MSEQMNRASRREIRRAMGDGAVATITELQAQIKHLTGVVNAHALQIDRLLAIATFHVEKIQTLERDASAQRARSLRARWLRWRARLPWGPWQSFMSS